MLQGMQKKSKERMVEEKDMDRKLGILADSSRQKKMMQNYFEIKEKTKVEEKRLNLGTERGINYHQFSGAKYKGGALKLTNEGLRSIN